MLLLCDFDGTITEQDITNLIWDHYLDYDWREELIPHFRDGKVNHFDLMAIGYEPITAPESELLDYVRPLVQYRAGFEQLVDFCKEKEFHFAVVSGGLDFYIKPYLPLEIPCYSYTAELNGHWEVKLPIGVTPEEGENYKVFVLEKLKREYGDREVIFLGDGRNDFQVAQHADRVFAVTGSNLAQLCREANIPCIEFDDFHEVVALLK
jgi:2-hydroxy-3-keto-5-methylthiopentenyl-1-phosphate phosphatase